MSLTKTSGLSSQLMAGVIPPPLSCRGLTALTPFFSSPWLNLERHVKIMAKPNEGAGGWRRGWSGLS
jgi:hypothetical protein